MSYRNKVETFSSSFTPLEKVIADYLFNYAEQAVKMSIHDIAKEINTSASSLTRFCHKLGYDTFREMRLDIVPSTDTMAVDEFNRLLNMLDDNEQFVRNYLLDMNDVCIKTLQFNEMRTIREIARAINSSNVVFLLGIGASALTAMSIETKLVKLGIPCVYNLDSDFSVLKAATARAGDLVIAISYGGITNDINRAARNAKENGCKVLAITREGKSPLSKVADYVLAIPYVEQVTRITTLYAHYAQLFLVDILFLCMVEDSGISSDTLLKKYRRVTRSMSETDNQAD